MPIVLDVTEAPWSDVIDHLAGIEGGSPLDALRGRRLQARVNSQASFRALFEESDTSESRRMSPIERFAVATFVAGLHEDAKVTEFYAAGLHRLSPVHLGRIQREISLGRASGPFGVYRVAGRLAEESSEGLRFQVSASGRSALGGRLVAAIEHAHMLTFRPREASGDALRALVIGGWSSDEIVTLSQLVGFLSYQIRVVAALRVLNASAP